MTTFVASIPSPPQGVWHLGWLPIRAYALFIIVGIIVALVIGDRRWVARGGEPGVIYDIALWAVPFGLIGGRLYHVMTDWRTYFGEEGAGLLAALRIWDGGLGIWGAVAFGGIGAWIGCRQRGIPLPAFGDAIAPGIVLAQAIGRLGNYFNQELFGRPTSLPWGLKIYERRDASGALDMLNGVSTGQPAAMAPHPVHPTFLYELIWNVVVFLFLIYVDRRFKMGHGRLFAAYVAAYCVGRFGVELLRDDTATLIAGVRINLFTSTFVFIGAMVYIVLAPKGRENPATLAGKPHEHEEPTAAEDKEAIPAAPEDSALMEWTRELAAVTSTTGVVAGVAVAVEDEDREEAEEEAEEAREAAAIADGAEESETAVPEEGSTPEADADEEAGAPEELEPEAVDAEAELEAPADEAVEQPEAEAEEAAAAEEPAGKPEIEEPGEALVRPKPRNWLRRLVSRKPRQPSGIAPESELETAGVSESVEPKVEAGEGEVEAAAAMAPSSEEATEPEVEEAETEEPGEAEVQEAIEPDEASAEEPGEDEVDEVAELGQAGEPEDQEVVESDEEGEPEAVAALAEELSGEEPGEAEAESREAAAPEEPLAEQQVEASEPAQAAAEPAGEAIGDADEPEPEAEATAEAEDSAVEQESDEASEPPAEAVEEVGDADEAELEESDGEALEPEAAEAVEGEQPVEPDAEAAEVAEDAEDSAVDQQADKDGESDSVVEAEDSRQAEVDEAADAAKVEEESGEPEESTAERLDAEGEALEAALDEDGADSSDDEATDAESLDALEDKESQAEGSPSLEVGEENESEPREPETPSPVAADSRTRRWPLRRFRRNR